MAVSAIVDILPLRVGFGVSRRAELGVPQQGALDRALDALEMRSPPPRVDRPFWQRRASEGVVCYVVDVKVGGKDPLRLDHRGLGNGPRLGGFRRCSVSL